MEPLRETGQEGGTGSAGCSARGGEQDGSLLAAPASAAASPACALLVGFYFFQLAFLNPGVFLHPSCSHVFFLARGEEKYPSAHLCHVPAPVWPCLLGKLGHGGAGTGDGRRGLHGRSCHQPQKLRLAGEKNLQFFNWESPESLWAGSEGTGRQQYWSHAFV